MKYIIVFLSVLLCSCSSNPKYTGQQFDWDNPVFYLSLAPSFAKPVEYEVQDNILVYREYSGLGGYKWGSRKVIDEVKISREEKNKLDELTHQAIADTIIVEKKRNESGEIIVVADGTVWYIQSGIVPFLSISTNNPESEAFSKILALLNVILERGQ
jgi:hypothetical protein